MSVFGRRLLIGASLAAAIGLAGCGGPDAPQLATAAPRPTEPLAKVALADVPPPPSPKFNPKYAALYQPAVDKFPVPGVEPSVVRKGFERKEVDYITKEVAGTIIVDPHAHYLYYVESNGKAMRYGVAVGKQGFTWSGEAIIKTKQEWPDWYPPKEMIDRHPELKPQLDKLQSGIGVAGGYRNPLGARAMYLWQGNKDTYFRIHGTLEPHSIGTNASSGCIRLINQDAIDLYNRVQEGTKVVVL